MKKTTILLILTFLVFSLNAQKIKIKKDIIYKDKIEIGRTEGKLAFFITQKDSLKIFGLNNDLIMTIRLANFDLKNPLFKEYSWYEIRFGDTNKKFALNNSGQVTSSESQTLKILSEKFEFEFDGKPIQNQDYLISKYNYHDTFVADTTAKRAEEAFHSQTLINNEILRDKTKPVKFITVSKDKFLDVYNIVQDNTVIAKLAKEYKRNMDGTIIESTTYRFSEILYEPIGEKGITELYAALITLETNTTYGYLFTFADKKSHQIKFEANQNIDNELLKILLKKNYL